MDPRERCDPPATHITLERLWEVMSQEHSKHHFDRQAILLESYLAAAGDRVLLADLQILTRVLVFLAERAERDARYREGCDSVLRLLRTPPAMKGASDRLAYFGHAVDFFSAVGCLLLMTNREEVILAILDVAEHWLPPGQPDDARDHFPALECVRALELSDFAARLAEFLAVAESPLYRRAVSAALRVCTASESSRHTLLAGGAVDTLLVRLAAVAGDERPPTVDVTCRLLWTLYESAERHPGIDAPPPSELALRGLRYLVREEALTPGRDPAAFQNAAALALNTVRLYPTAGHVLSGLFEDLTFLGTASESTIDLRILPYYRSAGDHLRLKRLALACLAVHPPTPGAVKIMEEYRVARCLVSMLGGSDRHSINSWPPKLRSDLFESALPVVSALYDSLQTGFAEAGLARTLVALLEVDGPQSNLQQRVVGVILRVCESQNDPSAGAESLRAAGAIPTLMNMCESLLKDDIQLTVARQDVLARSLCVLTKLIRGRSELLTELAVSSAKVVTALYARLVRPLARDSLLDHRLAMSGCYFAWEALLCEEKTALDFIRLGGVYVHLDILAVSPACVQLVYLSALVEIAERPQSVPYLVAWRGKDGAPLLSTLCRIWREEEVRLGVPRTPEGVVADAERPLAGEAQIRAEDGGATLGDLFASARPKIYAIVQLMRKHQQAVDLCESHCRLGHDRLASGDRVTLLLAESYIPLKSAEIWWETRLRRGGNPLTPLDRYLVDTLADRFLNLSLRVQRDQMEVLESDERRERDAESAYYERLRAARLPDALDALRQVTELARTSRAISGVAAQRSGLEASRAGFTGVGELRAAFPPPPRPLLPLHSRTDVVIEDNPRGHPYTLA